MNEQCAERTGSGLDLNSDRNDDDSTRISREEMDAFGVNEEEDGKAALNPISDLLRQRERELERYQCDLRVTRSKATEVEVQNAHTKALLNAAEAELRGFKESVAAILFDTSTATQSLTANEENIKRRIRELLEERSELQRNKKMDEQRNNSLREQLERANREVHTAEIERAALQRREKLHLVFVDKLLKALRLNEIGNELNIEIDDEMILARAEELVQLETDLMQLHGHTLNQNQRFTATHLPESKREWELRSLQLELLSKNMRCGGGDYANPLRRVIQTNLSKLDELNRQLITKLSLQQIKNNDADKRIMKHRLEEQCRLIRQLERKAREMDHHFGNFLDVYDLDSCNTVLSKTLRIQLQQLKIRLAQMENRECQFKYLRSRLLSALALPHSTKDCDIIRRVDELLQIQSRCSMVREKRCCARRYNLNVGVFSAALIHRSKSTDCIMARGLRRSARQRRSAENLCRRTDNGNDIGDCDSDNGQRQQQQQQDSGADNHPADGAAKVDKNEKIEKFDGGGHDKGRNAAKNDGENRISFEKFPSITKPERMVATIRSGGEKRRPKTSCVRWK